MNAPKVTYTVHIPIDHRGNFRSFGVTEDPAADFKGNCSARFIRSTDAKLFKLVDGRLVETDKH